MSKPKRLIIGISGASGAIYGIRLLEVVRELELAETHLIVSRAARLIIPQETDYTYEQVASLADVTYEPEDVGAPIASGSFVTAGMAIVPCSIKTLSAIANSYAADLISRAADVQLKEGRPLILAIRETPLHPGHIRLMLQAAEAGAVIMPPIPAFYSRPQTLDDLIRDFVGRVLLRLGFENQMYSRWDAGR